MSRGPDELLSWVGPLLYLMPLMVIWLAGIVVALARWQRHPMVSLLTVLALLIMSVVAVGFTLLNRWLITAQVEMGYSGSQIASSLAVLNVGRTLVTCLGYALLLLAVFGWRGRPFRIPMDNEPRPYREPPPDDAIRARSPAAPR